MSTIIDAKCKVNCGYRLAASVASGGGGGTGTATAATAVMRIAKRKY